MMERKSFLLTSFGLFCIIISGLGLFVQNVKAEETISIRGNGVIEPVTAPIITVDNILYTFTGNIQDSIIEIERDNIIIDGANFSIKGKGYNMGGPGILLHERNNVTIKNLVIQDLFVGIQLVNSSSNRLSGNNITNCAYGIYLSAPFTGVGMSGYPNSNTIFENIIADCPVGGIRIEYSGSNIIYHNDFVENGLHVESFESTNVWDNENLLEGNYWGNYTGVDTNSDGIGDTPHVLDLANQDRYPLMKPHIIPEFSTLILIGLFLITTFVATIYRKK